MDKLQKTIETIFISSSDEEGARVLEYGLLNNLQNRFRNRQIYTYCGIVLIAINPYSNLPIFDNDTIQAYRGQNIDDMDPHIFAVAEEAYTKLKSEQRDQSIVISGESGAGKTESAKYVTRYYATVGSSFIETQIEKKVLASSSIMEAIGNSKTTKNDNSSRFGKFIELQFNIQYHIIGASMKTYLFEKSRVVFHSPGEENYGIFYQLCSARGMLPYLHLEEPNYFRYLKQENTSSINGTNDLKSYANTVNALVLLDFTEKEQNIIFRIVAAVLHLGNVEFREAKISLENQQNQEGYKIPDTDESLGIVSELLDVNKEELKKWLCIQKIVLKSDIVLKAMTIEQILIARDALAKHIYAELFNWIALTVNKALETNEQPHKFIGVLDIYGFEAFELNSFEQLCINYANEKLQLQFNLHVFKLKQEEYIKEEIKWEMIDFYDNQPCVDLIEKKLGILDLLDEECKMPKGSDRSWVIKMYSKCIDFKDFSKPQFGSSAFIINHFAGEVQYESNGFLEKNRDTTIAEQIAVLKCSSNDTIRRVFSYTDKLATPGASTRSNSTRLMHKKTVGSQFRDSLNFLINTLNDTTPHYVRCIKPNDTKSAFEYNPQKVIQQLKACGILETIRISAAGFPNDCVYVDFFNRYKFLCKSKEINGNNLKMACKHILEKYIKSADKYQFGKTKIFFRAGQVAYLENLRNDKIRKCCIIIQRTIRKYLSRKRWLAQKNAAITLQSQATDHLAQQNYVEMEDNAISTRNDSSAKPTIICSGTSFEKCTLEKPFRPWETERFTERRQALPATETQIIEPAPRSKVQPDAGAKYKYKRYAKNSVKTLYANIVFACEKTNKLGKIPNFCISSWNVDAVRSWQKKDGLIYIEYEKPDIFCIQGNRCSTKKLPPEIKNLAGYTQYWHTSIKEDYFGAGLFSRLEPISVSYGINNEEQDKEGRCVTAEYDTFYVVSVNVPTSGFRLVTLQKRLEWNVAFKNFIAILDEKKPVIICGDMKVAHNEIDLANPTTNRRHAGFAKEEREGMTDFLANGFVDTFRSFYPDQKDAYTYWCYETKARAKNLGWHLDYFLISERYFDNVCDSVIRNEVFGSDHCPIVLFLNV